MQNSSANNMYRDACVKALRQLRSLLEHYILDSNVQRQFKAEFHLVEKETESREIMDVSIRQQAQPK